MMEGTINWAKLLYGEKTILFRSLEIGESFTFPTSGRVQVCVKTSKSGWYTLGGHRFQTGTGTAVKRYPESPEEGSDVS